MERDIANFYAFLVLVLSVLLFIVNTQNIKHKKELEKIKSNECQVKETVEEKITLEDAIKEACDRIR